jgi:hypothetical protein
MSAWKNAVEQKGLPKLNSIPNGSATVIAMYLLTVKPKAEKGWPSLSVIPLTKVSVPYAFSTSPSNLIKEADKDAKPKELGGGERSILVSMYKATDYLPGSICLIQGLEYNTFLTAKTSGFSYTCARITVMPDANLWKLMDALPLPNRTLSLERDVPPPAESCLPYGEEKEYRFLCIKVSKKEPPMGDGELYGKFTMPASKDASFLKFKPFTKAGEPEQPESLALTGGISDQQCVDHQFFLAQNTSKTLEDGSVETGRFEVLGRCKLFESSIRRLQVDWMKMAFVLLPHLEGLCPSAINQEKSRSLVYDTNSAMAGSIQFGAHLYPDLAAISRSIGIKVSWDSCLQLVPEAFKDLAKMTHPDFRPSDIYSCTGINILHFAGDISCLPEASHLGLVEFYVVSNILQQFAKDMNSKSEAERIKVLNNLDYYSEYDRVLNIYAVMVPNPNSKLSIIDYVSTSVARPPPARAEMKKVKASEPVKAKP